MGSMLPYIAAPWILWEFSTHPHSCWSSAHFAAADQGEVDTDPAIVGGTTKSRKRPLVICAMTIEKVHF